MALTIGLVAWILLWAIGWKPVDAFLITLLILLPVAAWQVWGSGIKKMLGQSPPPSSTP
ncbi:MAG TPA: hypothetical protein VH300_14095 [Thermoleophilaceae bacterium]|nr:hypothetical protein [Thermoleophilaceae bacterium]